MEKPDFLKALEKAETAAGDILTRQLAKTSLATGGTVPPGLGQAPGGLAGLEAPKFSELEAEPQGKQLQDMSSNELMRHVRGLTDKLNRMDLTALVAQARKSPFQHREAFMLMRYVSTGGTDVKLVWNSRDGVTPFSMHIGGMEYTHDIPSMQGPFFDRPEGIVAQWETRTEMAMMMAWRRVLNKGMLLGRFTEERVIALQNDPDAARRWNLDIGLRSMASGRFTDEEV